MALKLSKTGDQKQLPLKKNQALRIDVNLRWQAAAKPSGGFLSSIFGGGGGGQQDLDLGCMYEMADGSKHVIQALGNCFGSETSPPYIKLDKDDRSGNSTDGENLVIGRPDLIKRVLLFAYFYEGNSDFRSLATKVTIKATGHEDIVIELDNPSANQKFCALAMVTYDGTNLTVRKEETYHASHEATDRAYKFGFNWTPATK